MINYYWLFVGALLVSQVLSQDACESVTGEALESTTTSSSLLADIIARSGDGAIVNDIFTVTNVQILSEAQHEMQDRYRYTSALVSYNCVGMLDICDGTTVYTVQLTLGCVNNVWSSTILNDDAASLNEDPTASASTALVSNCILSVSTDNFFSTSLTIDPVTHCVGKSHAVVSCRAFVITHFFLECSNCNTGLRRCYGTFSAQTCCNFFYNNLCVVECPVGLFPDPDYVCGGKLPT